MCYEKHGRSEWKPHKSITRSLQQARMKPEYNAGKQCHVLSYTLIVKCLSNKLRGQMV